LKTKTSKPLKAFTIKTIHHWLLPQSCFLCGNISTKVLCAACLADLPFSNTGCLHCAKTLEQVDICHQCREEPPPYTHTQAVFEYIYPVNILIVEAKFNQNLAVLNFLGHLMGQFITIDPRLMY